MSQLIKMWGRERTHVREAKHSNRAGEGIQPWGLDLGGAGRTNCCCGELMSLCLRGIPRRRGSPSFLVGLGAAECNEMPNRPECQGETALSFPCAQLLSLVGFEAGPSYAVPGHIAPPWKRPKHFRVRCGFRVLLDTWYSPEICVFLIAQGRS